jgi:ATP-binding cassette subfamily G (WHITE) protein 2
VYEQCYSSFFLGTIVFSIHQPRYSIFKLFDTVLFLSGGHNIYLGPSIDVLPYFASNGYKCEEHDNPADFVLDVLIQSNNCSSNKLQTAYIHSSMNLNICKTIRNEMIENENKTDCLLKYESTPTYTTEFYYVAQRTFCNVLRNPSLVASQIISVIIYGLFTGLIFNKLEKTIDPGIFNRFGAIFFIISCQVLGAMSALETLIKERALFIHVN